MGIVTEIRIGSLIKTPTGVFGIVSDYNNKNKRYTINWVNGIRSSVSFDKNTILTFINTDNWLCFSPDQKVC